MILLGDLMNKIKKSFGNINNFLELNREYLSKIERDNLLDLTGKKFSDKLESVISKDGTLRIGVVGQVKAGKSSFINALLFDGKDILPKASTPMTASLAVIKYSKEIYAEVEFYSNSDWDIIERKAEEFEGICKSIEERFKKSDKKENIMKIAKGEVSDSISSSYELYNKAKMSGLDIKSYIGRREKISDNISSIKELVGKLHDYVGVDGKYTPFTKNINLYLDIPTLKGIELIDTPGTNDPIVSRGQTTRDFLSRCDSVFLLSVSSQFMGKEDAEFLVNTLPSEGVSSIILLGSKFDSVLVDEFKRYRGDIKRALRDLYQKLSNLANESLNRIISSNPNKPIMEKLRSRKVKFISAICYNIAKKGKKNLDEIEELTLNNLEKRYELEFSEDILFQLANIDSIKDNDLEEIKRQKEDILKSKLEDFISGQRELVIENLSSLEKNLEDRIKDIKSSNIEELIKRAKDLEVGFERARDGIEQIFVDFKFDIKEKLYKLIYEIDNQREAYTGVSRNKDTKEVYSHSVSTSTWYKPWTWGDSRSVYKTVYFEVANMNEAVDKAIRFIRVINESILDNWYKMINLKDIERKLIKEATNAFDLGDSGFNKNHIINPVKNALREITIKPYRVKEQKYINQITSAFSSSRVEDSEIDELEELLRKVLVNITNDMEIEIEKKMDEIASILDEKSRVFVDSIKSHSNELISKLREDLKDKKASISRDTKLVNTLRELKREL